MDDRPHGDAEFGAPGLDVRDASGVGLHDRERVHTCVGVARQVREGVTEVEHTETGATGDGGPTRPQQAPDDGRPAHGPGRSGNHRRCDHGGTVPPARGRRLEPGSPRVASLAAMTIKRVGIVGSGIMGSGIAEVAAKTGHEVVLRSRKQETADATVAGLEKSLAKQVEKGRLEESTRDEALARVTATSDLHNLRDCDLVIESVVEDLEVKTHLFNELDQVCRDDAILATNTSTLPVVQLAVEVRRPERVCGIHFFNPAPMMPLVEVVRPLTAADDTITTARAFADACGKSPVEVKDRAGFIVNALLFPYLNNAVRMLENGTASRDDIDTAMKGGCNFPMGPLELLDLVGLDTSLAILDALYEEFHDPNFSAVPLLRRMVAAGHLGRKSGEGFYDYAKK
ncbi:MAG: 3-hydroxybutyryl-CoA dehydrogenase [Acidimicrobiia bacterium]|nr:3-hydroxybutyryl-CoA dehydrogenase [Acidimicrobiia bacterium]